MNRLAASTLAASVLVLGVSSTALAAGGNPNKKSTVTDIQWHISYSQQIPGNCMIVGFSQWEAAKFRRWEAYAIEVTSGTPPYRNSVAPPPKYDDELKYGGNILSPSNGSHWVLIGDGTFRAGPPPAQQACHEILRNAQTSILNNKVTTFYRRTSVCTTKLSNLTDAQKAVEKARKAKRKNNTPESRKKLTKAKERLSKAEQSFDRDCSK